MKQAKQARLRAELIRTIHAQFCRESVRVTRVIPAYLYESLNVLPIAESV